MMKDKQLWRSIALILCVAGLMTFVHLGNLPLFDPDEPVYAETAREMLQFNDFVSPRIYGEFWYDKPPMYYWLVAGAFKIFGVGEFGARFPSAVLAVAGAVLVYLSGRKLFTERAGLLAALVLVTSMEYFYLSKASVTDMTLTFFLTGSLLASLHKKSYLFYGCAALFTTYVTGMLVFSGFLTTQMLPVVAPALSMKDTVKVFEKNYDGQSSVYVAKFYRPGFMFYSGMPGTEFKPDEMQIAMLNNTSKYFVIQKKNYEKFPPSLLEKVRLLTMIEDTAIFVRQAD